MMVEVKTQQELDEALKRHNGGKDATVACVGDGKFEIGGSSQVTACGSSQVTSYDSSQVTSYDSSQVRACGSSQVRATPYVAITVLSQMAKIDGGVQIVIPRLETPELWCEFYGVGVTNGVATLFKAVNDDYKSPHGTCYAPGAVPKAEDWDGGEKECGDGLHFSPRPFMALTFHPEAKRFVACPVALKDIAVHPDGQYPEKVKAHGCCAAIWECDIDGNPTEK